MSTSLPSHAQRGAALVVGLLFMIVMTLVGLVAVRATTQQSRMSANYQFQNTSFQAAESGIRGVVAEMRSEIAPPTGVTTNILVDAIDVSDPDPTRTINVGPGVSSQATVRYTGQGPAPGFSMGTGTGSVVAHRFEVNAESSVANTAAQAEHQQGVQRVGPGL